MEGVAGTRHKGLKKSELSVSWSLLKGISTFSLKMRRPSESHGYRQLPERFLLSVGSEDLPVLNAVRRYSRLNSWEARS